MTMRKPASKATTLPSSARPLSIIDALDDPALLGGLMDGSTWRLWRAFLGALFALPLDEDQLAIYSRHTGRQAPPEKPFRSATLIIGRRGGKSRCLGVVAAYLATMIDHRKHLVPGETPVIAAIARDRDQARVVLNYVLGTLRAVPALNAMIADAKAESVTLTNGVVIEVHTASIGAPRGRTFVAVLADETAFWPVGDSANPDVEVINAVRPGLTTIPYSLLLVASSPYAKRGVLYSDYAKYHGRDDAKTLVWKASSEDMNPTLAGDDLIETMYAEDPERAQAEFGGDFRTDIVAFITREAVEDVIAPGLLELPPASGVPYCGFVDPSGGSADSMTLGIAHIDPDGTAVLDALRETKPPFSPDAVVQDYAELLKTYGITRVVGDAYAGLWPRERFAVHGIEYEVSARNKNTIYSDFLPALNGRRVRLLDIPRLTAQLCGLERRTARGGRDSIDHAPGGHDDAANAVAGALTGVLTDRRPSLIRAEDMRVGGQGVPLPTYVDALFSMFVLAEDGWCAVVHCGYHQTRDTNVTPLVLLDFDAQPFSAQIVLDVQAQQEELKREVGRWQLSWIETLPQCVQQFRAAGIGAVAIEPVLLSDPAALALEAAGHVAAGKFKLSERAVERAKGNPLGGALTFRAGDAMDKNPLRLALLLAIGECLTAVADRQKSAAQATKQPCASRISCVVILI
jgi:hypothetical protein